MPTRKARAADAPQDRTYRISGGRVGVLLIHGLCGTPLEVRSVAVGLGHDGYTVHCPQIAGHGGTRQDLAKAGWKDWYRSVEVALEELKKECDTVIVGGLCIGSILSLHLAANHPDKVHGVVLLSPTLWINGWAVPWSMKLFALVRWRWLASLMLFPDPASLGIKCTETHKLVRTALASAAVSEFGSPGTPAVAVLEHRRMVKAAMKILKRVRQPTLIVHAREDDFAHISNAIYLQNQLGGAVDMLVLNDSYHVVTFDKERHLVVARTRSFVSRVFRDLRLAAADPAPVG